MKSNNKERPANGAVDWNEFEYSSRKAIRRLQTEKLQQQVQWVASQSPFWRERFETANVDPEEITDIGDLATVPFGTKEAYRTAQTETPRYGGLLCRDEETIASEGGFLWETSGTTGEPVKFFCSRSGDYEVDVAATKQILRIAGIEPGDTVAMFWPLTLWAVGHGIVDAAKEMNLTVLPLGPSYSTDIRIEKIETYRPDAIMTTPSYALRLAEVAETKGIDTAQLGIERAIVSGEPLPEATRKEIASVWGLDDDVYDYYGLSEAFNCRSIECSEHDGIHILENLYLCQVLDPNGTEPVDEGETGELVVTALEQRDIATGFHYRTGDLVRYTDEPCECGRSTRRIEIVARKDDMKTVRGVNVFPQAVESVVRATDTVNDEFRLVLEKDGQIDSLSVVVEPNADDKEGVRQQLERKLAKAFGGLSVDIEFVPAGELDRFDFKADRWVDKR